jgi:single-strand DNA-binding protein
MLNKVMLIGNLGKDPEERKLESGTVMAKFTLATNETYKDREGNRVKQTEWHNIVVWRRLAEVAMQYLKTGSLIYVEGRIKTRSWEDQDGNKKYMTEIHADNFQMLDKKDDSSGGSYSQERSSEPGGQSQPTNVPEPSPGQEGEDDLPF